MSKELQDKLDRAAKACEPVLHELLDEINKPSWSCNTCGATTTDPKNRLITYFHMDCPGK